MPEQVDLTQINVRIPRALANAAKRIAAHRGMTLNALIEQQVKHLMIEDAEALREQMRTEKEQAAREASAIEATLAELQLESTP